MGRQRSKDPKTLHKGDERSVFLYGASRGKGERVAQVAQTRSRVDAGRGCQDYREGRGRGRDLVRKVVTSLSTCGGGAPRRWSSPELSSGTRTLVPRAEDKTPHRHDPYVSDPGIHPGTQQPLPDGLGFRSGCRVPPSLAARGQGAKAHPAFSSPAGASRVGLLRVPHPAARPTSGPGPSE